MMQYTLLVIRFSDFGLYAPIFVKPKSASRCSPAASFDCSITIIIITDISLIYLTMMIKDLLNIRLLIVWSGRNLLLSHHN